MIELKTALLMVIVAVLITFFMALFLFALGGWIAFRCFLARPGESLAGKVPKGEVFTINTDGDDFPNDEEQKKAKSVIAKRAESFVDVFTKKI